MITFKEFFNKQDNLPLHGKVKPPVLAGMTVAKDYAQFLKGPEFLTPPELPKLPTPPRADAPLGLAPRRPLSHRPVERKPSHFLPRKSDPLKNKR
jgi:hypothetical protein